MATAAPGAFSTEERLLTPREAADYLGLTPRFLTERRHRGSSPPVIRLSSRCIRYRLSDLDEWIDTHRCTFDGACGEAA